MCLTAAPLDGFVGMELPDFSAWFADKASAAGELAATGQCGESVYWNFDSNTGKLTINGFGDMTDYYFDANSAYCDSPFYKRADIYSVTFGENITSIGDWSFYNCDNLKSINISSGIADIGNNALYDCEALEKINVEKNNKTYSSDEYGVLFNKDKSILIQHPVGNNRTSYSIPNSVLEISASAFNGCENLIDIDIPVCVEKVGADAFYDTGYYNNIENWESGVLYLRKCLIGVNENLSGDYSIKNGTIVIADGAEFWSSSIDCLTIPKSLKNIGVNTLTHLYNIERFTVDTNNSYYSSDEYGVLYNKNKTELIRYPVSNEKTCYEIPVSVIEIGSNAFDGSNLYSVTIPDGIINIGDEAFFDCDKLIDIVIPNSVKFIRENAFSYCNGLKNITIGSGVQHIGRGAFCDCSNLTVISVDQNNSHYSSDEFGVLYNKNKTELIQYPIGNKQTSYVIPDSVNLIGDASFSDAKLKDVKIPNSVTIIGDGAFYRCVNLTEITIPNSTVEIDDRVFCYCENLTNITIGVNVRRIGVCAFYACNVKEFVIPDSVKIIDDQAFGYCEKLETITIPNSIESIGRLAFYFCTNLNNVYYNGTEHQWKSIEVGVYNEWLLNATIRYNYHDFSEAYKKEHVVDNWKTLNQSYKSEYLAGFAVPMDGTNGNPDYLIPGQSENMIPQGLTYWPEKDWVLISSYDKKKNNPSAIFALDRETGKFVAQFNLYEKDGKPWKCHAGGIGVSEYNLYITCDRGVAYFPLYNLDVPSGTVKDIVRKDYFNVPYLNNADEPDEIPYTAYVNVSDGILWTGNFYSDTPCGTAIGALGILPDNWFWEADDKYNSIIVGYRLSGNNSEMEWKNLVDITDNANHIINVDNSIDCIQGVAFKSLGNNAYKMYLSRTTDASFGASISTATVTIKDKNNNDIRNIEVKENKFSYYKNLPGTEGIAFIGDDLHILYESGALSNFKELKNQAVWNQYFKDCTDVIWKVNEDDLLSIPQVDPHWFEDDAYSGYNHNLAKFCADYCALGYSYNIDEVAYYLDKSEFNVNRDYINMRAARDEVNYFIADKNIIVNGETKKLMFIGCIGSYTNQWYSNFDPWGIENIIDYTLFEGEHTHQGFANAREFMLGKINEYLCDNNIDRSNSIFLLTGHSRGAATVNLLAAKLIDNSLSFGIDTKNIYAYGFATPNTTKNAYGVCLNKYSSIKNIVNPEDLVTKLLPSSWKYGRYGETYTLPSKTNTKESDYNTLLKKVQKYTVLNGSKDEYTPFDSGEKAVYNLMEEMSDSLSGVSDFYNKRDIYTSSSTFEYFKNHIIPFVAGDTDWKDMASTGATILKLFTLQSRITTFFLDHQVLEPEFEESHSMKTYAAFVNVMTSTQTTKVREGYKGTVNCPVDIEIYDKTTGELVGRIVDNVVDDKISAKENSVVMSVDGDSKSFWLPSNGEYDIKLIGNDEGTMDYTMSEIDSDIGEIKRVNFFDVEITVGLTMTADVEGEDFVIEEHELIFEDGETLEPTEIFTEKDIETYNINISASEGGSASSSQTAKSGDYVSLDAIVEEGWKFAGWYENDELISTETTLAFVAKSDRKLEAKFEHVDHNFGDCYTATFATCTTPGLEKRDCSVCNYSKTQQIPATGHDLDGSACKNCDFDKSDDCNCKCHKAGLISKLIWKITNFFNKLLRRNQVCPCGIYHY